MSSKMINRIDMFMPPVSQYGVLHYFTNKLREALDRAGVRTRILVADRDNPKPFLESLFGDPPDVTLSFNGLLPDKNDTFFCDLIKIPHVACLVDSPIHFLQLKGSPLSIATCPDRDGCDFFRGMGFQNTLFMPHAVERELCDIELPKNRDYDVVVFASCIDYEKRKSTWKETFPFVVYKSMEMTCDEVLSNNKISFINAFVKALDHQSREVGGAVPHNLDLILALNEIETYIKGKDRVEVVKAIKDAKVDVFGSGDWKKYLGDRPNVTIHDVIPFEEVIEHMKNAKVVLNSCPWSKNGAHERLFTAMALGACVVTNDSAYLGEHFKDGQDIIFYQHGKWKDLNDKVNQCLNDEILREHMTHTAREKVRSHHTWDNRVEALLRDLPPILKQIRQAIAK